MARLSEISLCANSTEWAWGLRASLHVQWQQACGHTEPNGHEVCEQGMLSTTGPTNTREDGTKSHSRGLHAVAVPPPTVVQATCLHSTWFIASVHAAGLHAVGEAVSRGELWWSSVWACQYIKPLVNLGLTKQTAKSLASKLSYRAIQKMTTIVNTTINTRHALHFQGASGGGVCWARGGEEWEKEIPDVQEHGGQPSRSPLALFLALT
eukprot:1158683-Pelagomonas_calceolata.AAC.9